MQHLHRLWLQSLTGDAIRNALQKSRPGLPQSLTCSAESKIFSLGCDYDNLADAADCRPNILLCMHIHYPCRSYQHCSDFVAICGHFMPFCHLQLDAVRARWDWLIGINGTCSLRQGTRQNSQTPHSHSQQKLCKALGWTKDAVWGGS